MKIVLSPAKNIDFRDLPFKMTSSQPVFELESYLLAKKLEKISRKNLEKMMSVSADIAELNKQRYSNWSNGKLSPAISLFKGEVYRGLDVDSWGLTEGVFAQENLRILSGLYGILKPMDLIQPYRLEMGQTWAITATKKNLYAFWGSRIENVLVDEMRSGEVLINLASIEYFKSIQKINKRRPVITPIFQELKGDNYKTVMTFAKQARGKMSRFIIQNQITNPEDIKAFNQDGYAYHQDKSSETDWYFTR